MSFPLRYQFTVALVGLNIAGTAALAVFGYRASRTSLEQQATQAVGIVAQERDHALVSLVERRQQRMNALLQSVESLCSEETENRLAWSLPCVRLVLGGFRNAERVTGADLVYRGRRIANYGVAPSGDVSPATPVVVSGRAGQGDYTMQARRGELTLRARFPLDDVDAIFQDRSGLEANGEVFLVDALGQPLTKLRYSSNPERPVLAAALQPCLTGVAGQTVVSDYRGTDVLSGFRPAQALGGACVVANVQYADFLVPIGRLGRQFLWASAGFIFLGVGISLAVARAATRPIARLAAAARALENGQFGQTVPVGGPTELRRLGGALSSMARSIGDLVHREHEARLAAESANRSKDDFLAMISHELRTPLSAIVGWVSVLLQQPDQDAVTSRGLQAIERSARAQTVLVNDLLDISRIVSGRLRLNLALSVSLPSVVDAALETVRPVASAKRITIQQHLGTGPLEVPGDAGRLQQVVGNLLSNAVKFTPAGGRIDITIDWVDDALEISVSDTGIGISAELLPRVFDRFVQADTSTTRTYGGLGLGLSIAQQLVELHGGTVRAESAGPGKGATFTVSLSATVTHPALPQQSESTQATAVPPLLGGTRVVVVDDDAATRGVLRAILEEAGATVATLPSAADAREFLEREGMDLLIADIGMPGEDGYSLIRSLRALELGDDTVHVPAIALTAHARQEDEEAALASGFQMYVAKPVDSSSLLSAVTTTLLSTHTH